MSENYDFGGDKNYDFAADARTEALRVAIPKLIREYEKSVGYPLTVHDIISGMVQSLADFFEKYPMEVPDVGARICLLFLRGLNISRGNPTLAYEVTIEEFDLEEFKRKEEG